MARHRNYILLFGLFALIAADGAQIGFTGKTKYLNNAKAVVTHSIDDSTKYVPQAVDAMDKYGIKATIFISTENEPAPEDRFFTQLQAKDLWPRLEAAFENGHEIGSHSKQHPCKRPDVEAFCSAAYSDYEIAGSRDDILKLTKQPYVWTWCYPCGNCANYDFIQKKIAAAGYLVARNYPNEAQDGHIRPDLQTWDNNPMNAGYTQVVQKRGGAAKTQIIDVDNLNAKFDEIYAKGGIYNFMSHPQWLDFGPEGFYEKHLAHISHHNDVWYVPMGPLYAFKTLRDDTKVEPLKRRVAKARFSVASTLNSIEYNGSVTLEFTAPKDVVVFAGGKELAEKREGPADRWDQEYWRREGEHVFVTVRPHTTVEFR